MPRGGLLSINHDKPDIPWSHDWPEADCMEVWQHPWLAWNWVSLERWQQRLAAGHAAADDRRLGLAPAGRPAPRGAVRAGAADDGAVVRRTVGGERASTP